MTLFTLIVKSDIRIQEKFLPTPMYKITPFLSSRVQKLPGKEVEKASGALLLSDISGFTALSETLAKEGKEGIEELTHILNNYFDAMLKIIQKHGGDVLKFSGDALLVGFYHCHSESIVRTCAKEMMASLKNFKGIKTRAGKFDISMKVVSKNGQWNELILGDNRRRELFLCGGTVKEILLIEEQASKGDIIIKWSETDRDRDREQKKPKRISKHRLVSFLPQGVSDFVDREFFGEHRAVSTVFLNFDGYDEENPSAKLLQAVFGEVISITEKYGGVIHDLDIHSQGSNIMIPFGAPVSHENDAERAVLASIELSKLDIKPLRVKVGVCTGFVYTGIIGSDWRKEYAVIGDTVNTAERLMETADYGEAIISDSTYYLTSDKIEYRQLKSVEVKGKEKELKRFIPIKGKEEKFFRFEFVGREKELGDILKAIETGGKVIILKGIAGLGKSRLLYEIKKKLDPTHKILEGYTNDFKKSLHLFASMIAREANIYPDDPQETQKKKLEQHIIGTTKLGSAQLEQHIKGLEIRKLDKKVKAEEEIGDGELYQRISVLSAMLFGIRYPDSLYERLDSKLRFENLCDALRYYIEYQTTRKDKEQLTKVVIIFDDFQWTTKDDLKIIEYITRILLTLSKNRKQITFIFATRPEPNMIDKLSFAKGIESLKLELSQLKVESTSLLTGQILNNKPLPEKIAKIISDRAGGNPLYLEQFLMDLIEKGLIKEKKDRWVKTIKFKGEEIPENVFSAIMSRTDRLSAKAKEALYVGSVIGIEFTGKVVEIALNEPDASRYLVDTEKKRLTYRKVLKEGEYIFRHTMIREVIYDSILRSRRKVLHKSVGEAIESLYKKGLERFYGILAYHFNQAGEWKKALAYNLKAGEKAKKKYRNEDAIQYFSGAAEIVEEKLPQNKEKLYDAYKGLGDVYSSISSYSMARGYYQNAVISIGTVDKQKLVDVLNGIADTYYRQGDYKETLRTGDEAYNISCKIKYKKGIAINLNRIGNVHWNQSRYEEALKCYKESLEIARESRDKRGIAGSLGNIGIVRRAQGRYEEALSHYEESMRIFKEIGDKSDISGSLNRTGNVHWVQGRYEEALLHYEDSLKINREIGDKSGISANLNNIGNVHWNQDRYEEALLYYKESLEIRREIGDKSGIATSLNNIGAVHESQSQYEEALSHYKEALKIGREIGNKSSIATTLNNIGVIHETQGRYEEALPNFEESLKIEREIGDKSGIALSLNNIGVVHETQGRYEEALPNFEESLKIRRETGNKLGIAQSLGALGNVYISLGLFKNGIKNAKKAQRIFEEIGAKSELLGIFAMLIYGYAELSKEHRESYATRDKETIEKADEIEKEIPESKTMVSFKLSISRFYEREAIKLSGEQAIKKIKNAVKYAEEALEKAKELKQLSNQAKSYLRLCELLGTRSKKQEARKREYVESALSIAEKTKSLPLLWKSHYWMYKATGNKSHLKKAEKCLKEQFKHIPTKYLNDFKQWVKRYTGEKL